MGNIFKKIFSLTRDNESKPDFQTCCTPMEVFDEQKVKAIVKHWLLSIDEYETIPDDIVALNFNLWEAVEEDGVDLMGYTPWGCIDCVSFTTGEMKKRYGFIYVDRDNEGNGTLERSKKDSYDWYKKVIASNGENL